MEVLFLASTRKVGPLLHLLEMFRVSDLVFGAEGLRFLIPNAAGASGSSWVHGVPPNLQSIVEQLRLFNLFRQSVLNYMAVCT